MPKRRAGWTRLGGAITFSDVFRHDYIKRQIEMLAQALASIARKRVSGEQQSALEEAQRAYALLGVDSRLMRLDARSLIALMGSKQKTASLVELLKEEARIRALMGQLDHARELEERARELAQ